MAKKYDTTNTWNLFKVKDEDRKTDSHPNYSGWINVDGKEFYLTGWVRQGKQSGRTFLGGDIKPKDQQASNPSTSQVKDDTEIPF